MKKILAIRIISLVFLAFSFLGWAVFVGGFNRAVSASRRWDDSFNPANEPSLYAFWVVAVVGPVVHSVAAIHALLCHQRLIIPAKIFASVTTSLFMMYITAVGFVMIFSFFNANSLFASGCFITTVFWTLHLGLWPWFKFVQPSDYLSLEYMPLS